MQAESTVPDNLPADLLEYRRQYRQNVVGNHYSGVKHLLFVVFTSLAIIGFSIWMIEGSIRNDWGTILYTFLAANFVEYLGHRYPMHHRIRGFWAMFHRHALEHHQFFTERWMTCRSTRDYRIVLFPPVMLFFYFGIVALPVGTLLFLLHRPNVAWLYVATAMFYFLQYETLHFCYHIDESSWITKLPIMRRLREHHRVHHTQELMTRCNFNITWPIADFVFRTIHHERNETPTVGNGVEPKRKIGSEPLENDSTAMRPDGMPPRCG